MESSGNTEKEKRGGPRIEPFGTPHKRGALEDMESPRLTQNVRSVKWDWNHSNTAPLVPTHCFNREVKMSQSTVSNVGVKSKRSTIQKLKSVAKRMPLKTLKHADSVLGRFLKPGLENQEYHVILKRQLVDNFGDGPEISHNCRFQIRLLEKWQHDRMIKIYENDT